MASPENADILLFTTPEMLVMAESIVSCSPEKIHLHELKWNTFRDGFPDLFIKNVKNIRYKDVAFLCSLNKPEIIFEQVAIIYALPRYLAKSLKIILPFFPTGTMERIDEEGQVATAMTLARILSAVPPTLHGPPHLMTYDIHALSLRFYFKDDIIPVFESAIPPLLIPTIKKLHDHDKVSVAFPDEGAFKRFNRFFSGYPTVICTKIREGDKRVVKIKEGDVEGRHVVIVDDLVQTGGTLIECAKALWNSKAINVSAFVTHAVFPQGSEKRFLKGLGDGYFDASNDILFSHFWITDSSPIDLVKRLEKGEILPPFELLTLAPAIAEELVGKL